jgi:hypothetical protein
MRERLIKMKSFRLLGMALVAVFAFSVVVAAVASAETATFLLAEWLVGGTAVAANLPATVTGELLLEDTNALKAGIKADALCSGILVGTIGVNGAATITEALNLEDVGISLTALSGTSIACTDDNDCESAKAWAVNLPWTGTLELIEQTSFTGFAILLEKSGANPGWYVECTLLGVKATDECNANTEGVAEAKNVAGGVEGVFSEAFTELAGLKLALCSSSGEETGIVEGTGLITTTEAPLTVSSTG